MLVIGIVVDQMRYDYLFKYWDKFGEGGFKRLVNEGFLCRDAEYNYAPTYTGPGHSSIYTGATPSVHGIIANDWYDRKDGANVYCVGDSLYSTVGAKGKTGKMSPLNLRVETIGDEMRLWSNMKSKVIGISLKDRASILPAGRAASAAYWYDAASGNFITSTYYMKALPDWLVSFNKDKRADNYTSRKWETLLPISEYTESGSDYNKFESSFKTNDSIRDSVFPHDLPRLKALDAEIIRKTPFGNSLLKDLAELSIQEEHLGKGSFPDFLAISFSSTDYVGHQYGPASIELEDTYLRLDKDLAEFLEFIDNYIGKDKALVFLTADHGAAYSANQLDSANIANRVMESKPLKAELEGYLNIKYGAKEESWVSSVSNNQVFLNVAQLRQYSISLDEMASSAVTWIERERGIFHCYTAQEMRVTLPEGMPAMLQRGFYPKRSGDVVILSEPYCGELSRRGSAHSTPYHYDTHVPVIFYGWQVQHGETERHVDITDIAPTVASFLNIDAPNGCTGRIIEGMRKK